MWVDDPRTRDVVAVLGGIGDRPALLGDAALDHQVDDQLQLMQALEVGDLGLVAGLDQGLEPVHDQLRRATTQDRLLAEKIGFGLLGESRLDPSRAQATNRPRVGLRQLPGLAGLVLLDGDEHRNPASIDVFAAHDMARSLGGNHGDVDAGRGLDIAETDVEAVPEEQRRALLEVRGDRLGVDHALDLVRGQDHDQVGLLDSLGHRKDLQALGLCLGLGPAALGQSDANVDSGVAQVQRMGVTLAAISDNSDLAALNYGQICIIVVEHFGHGGLLQVSGVGWDQSSR